MNTQYGVLIELIIMEKTSHLSRDIPMPSTHIDNTLSLETSTLTSVYQGCIFAWNIEL